MLDLRHAWNREAVHADIRRTILRQQIMKTSFCFKKCKHCGLRGLVFMFQKNYCVVCRQILSMFNRTRVVD
jgi:hypothetical protein